VSRAFSHIWNLEEKKEDRKAEGGLLEKKKDITGRKEGIRKDKSRGEYI
jgi:hypothetical protein